MKSNIKLSGVILWVTVLINWGCADGFLDVKPRGKEIASAFEHYNGLLNSFDLVLYGDNGATFYSMFMSDEFYSTPASLERLALNTQEGGRKAYCYEADVMRPDELSREWGYNRNMYTYNLIIRDVMEAEGGTQGEKLSVLSEARVMRAWLHFCTAQYFCKPYDEATAATDPGLPAVTVPSTTESDFERGTLKDLYDFIITEMEESCPHIQNSTNHIYRTEQSDAYTMLGMIRFYMRQYDKALYAFRLAKQYADENGASFLYDYNEQPDMWITALGPIHYEDQEAMRDLYYTQFAFMYIPGFYQPAPIYVKEKYYNLFSENDRRKKRFVMEGEDEYWRPCLSSFNAGPCSPELYIMLAECEAREGDAGQARALLEEFRKSRMPEAEAVVPAELEGESLIRFCVEERIREVLGSGKFWLDMRRLWNDPLFSEDKASWYHPIGDEKYVLTEERLVMRIPPKVMQWNDWEDND